MGLDTVEFILEAEERFGVSFTEEDWACMETFGDLRDRIVMKLQVAPEPTCLTRRVFFRVRRAMTDTLPVARRDVRPTRRLADLVPRADRRAVWHDLGVAMDLELPDLERPITIKALIAAAVLFVGAFGIVGYVERSLPPSEALSVCVGSVVLWWLSLTATRPLALHFPTRTAGDLTRSILALNVDAVLLDRRPEQRWSAEEVWEVIAAMAAPWGTPDHGRLTPDTTPAEIGMD